MNNVSHDLSKDALQRDTEMENVWAKVRYPEDRPSSNTHLWGETRESKGIYRLEAIIKNMSQSWKKTWILVCVCVNNFFIFKCFYWSTVDLQCFRAQQRDSVLYIYIYTYIYILFQIPFHYRSLQETEYSSLCYIVGFYCLLHLCIVVCIC